VAQHQSKHFDDSDVDTPVPLTLKLTTHQSKHAIDSDLDTPVPLTLDMIALMAHDLHRPQHTSAVLGLLHPQKSPKSEDMH
jgi:hypothetical protein